jgi:hypothetical protein
MLSASSMAQPRQRLQGLHPTSKLRTSRRASGHNVGRPAHTRADEVLDARSGFDWAGATESSAHGSVPCGRSESRRQTVRLRLPLTDPPTPIHPHATFHNSRVWLRTGGEVAEARGKRSVAKRDEHRANEMSTYTWRRSRHFCRCAWVAGDLQNRRKWNAFPTLVARSRRPQNRVAVTAGDCAWG